MSDKVKHTQGPWWFAQDPYGFVIGAGDFEIAFTVGSLHNEENQTRANARLIAAAPDMLESLIACEDLLSELEDGGAANPELTLARAAIAKATGNA
jgi:hypothetical protein